MPWPRKKYQVEFYVSDFFGKKNGKFCVKPGFIHSSLSRLARDVLVFCLVFVLCASWLFSGWPQIWNDPAFPPAVQQAWADTQVTTVEAWASDINGWTWTTVAGCAGPTFTQGFDGADGNLAGSAFSDITNKKNGSCEGYFSKTFTWESLSIPAGNTVTQVDGKFDYSHPVETDASVQSIGLMIYDSANSTNITNPDADLETAFDPGAPSASWSTRDTDGAKDIDSAQQASNTTITVRAYMLTASGNANGADSRNLMDNIVFTMTHSAPATVSVTVDDGTVAYGTLAPGATNDTFTLGAADRQVVENNGDVTIFINIKGATTDAWDIVPTGGSLTEEFVHRFASDDSGAALQALTNSYTLFAETVAAGATRALDLEIEVPTTTTETGLQTADVTLQAVQE